MSVIMLLQFQGDPAAVERYAAENAGAMQEIVEHAKQHGLIAHRFYGRDGELLVVDEWPDEQSFLDFFAHMEPHIAPIMQAAGVTSEPNPTFWRKLETHDDYGWE
jgi:quinol monooxygenase YgiN